MDNAGHISRHAGTDRAHWMGLPTTTTTHFARGERYIDYTAVECEITMMLVIRDTECELNYCPQLGCVGRSYGHKFLDN